MNIKRQLYLYHRWAGVALCLFFAMWFFSGVVMMYIGFPKLTETERINALPALPTSHQLTPLSHHLSDMPQTDTLQRLSLSTLAGRPVYKLYSAEGWRVIYADTGEVAGEISPDLAYQSAKRFLANTGSIKPEQTLKNLGMVETDQWSVSGSLNTHRPLYRFLLDDTSGSIQLYVSSRTGEVVRDVSGLEKAWNWLGANLHWIYPVQLRKHVDLWVDVVIVLSLLCFIPLITGAIVGIMRVRIRKPYKGKHYTPYKGVAKVHHIMGLVVLLILVMYLFSGLMSMNPWGIFDDEDSFAQQQRRYQLGERPSLIAAVDAVSTSWRALLQSPVLENAREVHWYFAGGDVSWLVYRNAEDFCVVTPDNINVCERKLLPHIEDRVRRLLPDDHVVSLELLQEYDNYYYSHHGRLRPLPVWRVKFSDRASSWFYIDAMTGKLQRRVTRTGRVKRWLYNGLHSLDFSILIERRPLWDIVVILLCAAGFIFSISGVVLAVRRTKTSLAKTKKRTARGAD